MSTEMRLGYGVAAALMWVCCTLYAPALGIVIAFIGYDCREFQPRRAEIDLMLANASPLERSPPPLLPLLQRADAGEHIAWQATRVIIFQLDHGSGRRSTLAWKSRAWLWIRLVELHLTEDEQLLIDRSRARLGDRAWGFAAGALSVFGRPLDQLTDQELAQLVVIARSPGHNRRPERAADVQHAAAELLERVRNATQPAR